MLPTSICAIDVGTAGFDILGMNCDAHSPGPVTICVLDSPEREGKATPTSVSKSPICRICCRPIEPSDSEKNSWKSHFRKLLSSKPVQVRAFSCREFVHSCCWEVAICALNCPRSPTPQISLVSKFIHHLRMLPSERTPFDCETDDIDHELLIGADYPSQSKSNKAPDYTSIFAPLLCHGSLDWLEQSSEALTIAEVKKIDPFLAYCLCKAMPHSLSSHGDMDVRPYLQKLLRRLMIFDKACFPKTHNLRVVWLNVTAIKKTMERSLIPPPRRCRELVDPLFKILKCWVPIHGCHRLNLIFGKGWYKHMRNQSTAVSLIAFGHEKRCIERPKHSYSYCVVVKVHSLRGLRFLHGKSGGISALKFKDGGKWTRWYGEIERGAKDEKHEWDECEKEFILLYDVGHSLLVIALID